VRVLFLKDVAPSHRAGDVKEVKNGFGRNYLVPRGLAALATKEALKQATALRAAAEERRLKEAADWQTVANELKENPVVIPMRSGPTGRLYGSVTNSIIAAKLSEMTDRVVDRRGIQIPSPIRQVGTFKLQIRLFEEVGADIDVIVEAESDGTEEFFDEEPVTVAEALEAVDQAEAEDDAEATSEEAEGDSAQSDDQEDSTKTDQG
jgi:large subunit ribosomal protein L9